MARPPGLALAPMALRDYLAGEVAEDFADGMLDRREALRRLGLLGLSLTSASALLAACGGDDDDGEGASPTTGAGSSTSAGAGSSTTAAGSAAGGTTIRFAGPAGELQAAFAAPDDDPKGAVLVIHENRGLTPHFFDLVGRLATEGYAALSVDLLSAEGGTASLADPASAPTALGNASEERLLGDLGAGIDELQRRAPGAKVGAVGFCFGGGMAWQLVQTGDQRLAAVVPFYGPAPANPDFSKSKAAVLGVYGALDGDRVNGTRDEAEAALQDAGLTHEITTYEGADHAFFNDTGQRYNPDAAGKAWIALLAWFDRHLA